MAATASTPWRPTTPATRRRPRSTPQTTTLLDTTPPSSTASSPTATNQTTFNVAYTAADNPAARGSRRSTLYAQAPGQTRLHQGRHQPGRRHQRQLQLHRRARGTGPTASTRSPPTRPATLRPPPQARRPPRCSTRPPPTSTASSPEHQQHDELHRLLHGRPTTAAALVSPQVELYAKTPGQTAYTKVATNTSGSGSGSFSYTATAGNGTYSFYTIATDQAGNVQATPSSPQTTTSVENATTTTVAGPASDATEHRDRRRLDQLPSCPALPAAPPARSPSRCSARRRPLRPPARAAARPSVRPRSRAAAPTTRPAGYTPAGAGTYWWYASYGGDRCQRRLQQRLR